MRGKDRLVLAPEQHSHVAGQAAEHHVRSVDDMPLPRNVTVLRAECAHSPKPSRMYRDLLRPHLLVTTAQRRSAGASRRANRAYGRHTACMPVAHDANAAYSVSRSDAKATSRSSPPRGGCHGSPPVSYTRAGKFRDHPTGTEQNATLDVMDHQGAGRRSAADTRRQPPWPSLEGGDDSGVPASRPAAETTGPQRIRSGAAPAVGRDRPAAAPRLRQRRPAGPRLRQRRPAGPQFRQRPPAGPEPGHWPAAGARRAGPVPGHRAGRLLRADAGPGLPAGTRTGGAGPGRASRGRVRR